MRSQMKTLGVASLAKLREFEGKTLSQIIRFCDENPKVTSTCFSSREALFAIFSHLKRDHRNRAKKILNLRADIQTPSQCEEFIRALARGIEYLYGQADDRYQENDGPVKYVPIFDGEPYSPLMIYGSLPSPDNIIIMLESIIILRENDEEDAEYLIEDVVERVSGVFPTNGGKEFDLEFRTELFSQILEKTLHTRELYGHLPLDQEISFVELTWNFFPGFQNQGVNQKVIELRLDILENLPSLAREIASFEDVDLAVRNPLDADFPQLRLKILFANMDESLQIAIILLPIILEEI